MMEVKIRTVTRLVRSEDKDSTEACAEGQKKERKKGSRLQCFQLIDKSPWNMETSQWLWEDKIRAGQATTQDSNE
ncbi:hypothetical protein Peur_033488 [Populus x canadensis]